MLNELEQVTLDRTLSADELQRYLFRLVEDLNFRISSVENEAENIDISAIVSKIPEAINGQDGATYYTWIKYSPNSDGSEMTNLPTSTTQYIGISYNNLSPTESTNPTDYTWSRFRGQNGVGVSSVTITYGKSNSESTEPSSWGSTAPELSKGDWLWVKTVTAYTNSTSSTTYQKSYIGTDGEDGNSVYIVSATKVDGVTTVVLNDGTTMTIRDGEDGEDGTDGTNGTNGLNGYVHIAWANSADGTVDFSTSVSTNKQYMGVYTDNTLADSTTPSDYSWSKIKGEQGIQGIQGIQGNDGDDGADGQSIWTTGTAPTTPNYTFTISNLSGGNGTPIKVGDIILYSYYRYTVTSVSTTTVLAGNRQSLRGATGAAGADGEDGISVTAIDNQYYYSTSPTELSGGGWSTDMPTYDPTKYLWIRQVISYSNGTTTYTTAAHDYEFDDAISRLSDVESSVDGITITVNGIEVTVEANAASISGLTGRVDGSEAALSALSDIMTSQGTDISGLFVRVNGIDVTLEDYQRYITELRAANSALAADLAQRTQQLNDIINSFNNYVAEEGQYMRHGTQGLELGATGSNFKTVIDNQRMAFMEGSTVAAYVSGQMFNMNNAVVRGTLKKGGYEEQVKSDGSVYVVWAGV